MIEAIIFPINIATNMTDDSKTRCLHTLQVTTKPKHNHIRKTSIRRRLFIIHTPLAPQMQQKKENPNPQQKVYVHGQICTICQGRICEWESVPSIPRYLHSYSTCCWFNSCAAPSRKGTDCTPARTEELECTGKPLSLP
jgi:hypothetical protein